ncbi:MAG: hypothetical protein ACREEM_50115, partial [Blastocatellia bacterium]
CSSIVPPGALQCRPSCTLGPTRGVCQQCSNTPTSEDLRNDSVVHPQALLNYPKTKVHFLYGTMDCGESVPIGLTWSTNVTSAKVIEFVPNTPHVMASTTEGRAAIIRAIEQAATTPPQSVISVSAASYSGAALANESIVSAFGSGLATATMAAPTIPLPTTLGNTTVKVRDGAGTERLSPLFFVSPTQVNYQIPPGTAIGSATITITNGHIDVTAVTQVLQTHDLIFGQNAGLGSARDQVRLSEFMNGVRADKGAAWKAEVLTKANELIAAHRGKAHKAYWQFGNEISSETFSETIRVWASAAGLPYPSPYTPFNDRQAPNDRGYIGYFVEYYMAPALESLLAANAAAAPEDRIIILTGSLANAAGDAARNSWLPAHLNYVIRGDYAPSLTGKTVASQVQTLTIHYTGGQQAVIDALYDTWVTPGSAIGAIWATEEIGIWAAEAGRGGLSALRVFARYMDVWLRRGLSSRQARVTYYAPRTNGPNPNTSGDYALTKLDAFIPSATTGLARKAGLVTTDASTAVETYAYESANRDKRIVFVFLTAQDATGSLQQIRVKADGWATTATGVMHVFSTAGDSELPVSISKDQDSYLFDLDGVAGEFGQSGGGGAVPDSGDSAERGHLRLGGKLQRNTTRQRGDSYRLRLGPGDRHDSGNSFSIADHARGHDR